MPFEYELAIEKDGDIRISVYTKDPAVALEINRRITAIAHGTLEFMDAEMAAANGLRK